MSTLQKIQKILIANRGEIACRIARTAHALGYRTVAVYSEADANAPHVALADEAVCIGPAPATASYLNSAALLEAARRTGAQAVHPGYGFLSENADFAQACLDAGLVFIGPSPSAIRAMGDKAQAKRRMAQAGVPTVPGFLGDELKSQSDVRLCSEAAKLGFPLLVKAVAGGGGRGMRRADALADMPEAIAAARREALAAFGDGTLMLERLIEQGRHIEIQVFADAHGNAVHLGERDCTAQRRRQKVIEEAPSPVVSAEMRAARMHTSLLDEWATQPILQRPQPTDADWFLATALLVSPPGQRAASVAGFDLHLRCGDETRRLRIETSADTLRVGNLGKDQTLHPITIHAIENGQLRYTQDGIGGKCSVYCSDTVVHLAHAAAVFVFTEVSAFPTKTAANDPRLVRAPVAGTLTRLEVTVGAPVAAGQTLAVIEAMKMEMRLCAAAAGTVTAIHAQAGTQVENAAVLIELKLNESA